MAHSLMSRKSASIGSRGCRDDSAKKEQDMTIHQDMTLYPVEFHRRLEQKQILTVTNAAPPPRDPNDDVMTRRKTKTTKTSQRAGGRPRTRRRLAATGPPSPVNAKRKSEAWTARGWDPRTCFRKGLIATPRAPRRRETRGLRPATPPWCLPTTRPSRRSQ